MLRTYYIITNCEETPTNADKKLTKVSHKKRRSRNACDKISQKEIVHKKYHKKEGNLVCGKLNNILFDRYTLCLYKMILYLL